MKPIIQPVERKLIINELTPDKYIRDTNRGGNMIYDVSAEDSPNIMREIGRLREVSFRSSGGGTGKDIDIDEYDTDPEHPYRQLIVWDPDQLELVGGYRYIDCFGGLDPAKMATSQLFNFSEHFIKDVLPYTIELGRSFVQPLYHRLNLKRKGIFALDNLWDGLGALTVKYDTHRYFFGKVTMYSTYNVKARNILLYFLNYFFPDKESLVTPIEPLDTDADNPYYASLFEGLDYKEAYKQLVARLKEMGEMIPPLINSYMSLSPSMRVFGTSVNKEFGGVEETGILMKIDDIYPEKIERHIASLKSLREKIKEKYRWWRR